MGSNEDGDSSRINQFACIIFLRVQGITIDCCRDKLILRSKIKGWKMIFFFDFHDFKILYYFSRKVFPRFSMKSRVSSEIRYNSRDGLGYWTRVVGRTLRGNKPPSGDSCQTSLRLSFVRSVYPATSFILCACRRGLSIFWSHRSFEIIYLKEFSSFLYRKKD